MLVNRTPSPDPMIRASQLASLAFERLGREGMAPTPENYALWYSYFSGDMPDLVRAIDLMEREGQGFTQARCDDLFRRFFRFDAEAHIVRQTGERTQGALSKLLEVLQAAGRDTGHFRTSLLGFRNSLEEPVTVVELRAIIGEIAAETLSVVQRHGAVEAELQRATEQIAEMRAHLQTARREALSDSLTGINNRKAFDLMLAEETAAASESNELLCLVFIDIDNFKKFNDKHGHLVGDHVLKLVARSLCESIKGRDTAARYGGEEFAIILPATSLLNAMALADRIRNTVARRRVVNRARNEDFGSITLSAGVAQFRPGEPVNQLIHRADQALYLAKARGRNCVVTESALVDEAKEQR